MDIWGDYMRKRFVCITKIMILMLLLMISFNVKATTDEECQAHVDAGGRCGDNYGCAWIASENKCVVLSRTNVIPQLTPSYFGMSIAFCICSICAFFGTLPMK